MDLKIWSARYPLNGLLQLQRYFWVGDGSEKNFDSLHVASRETNFLLWASVSGRAKALLQILHEICSSGPTKRG